MKIKLQKQQTKKSTWGGVPSSNIDTDKAAEPEDKKPSDAKEETKSEEKAAEEKANEEDKKSEETNPDEKKSEEVNPDEKKDDNTEAKSEDEKKDTEAEVKPEEDKKQDEAKPEDAKTEEEKAEETKTEEEKAKEGENAEEGENSDSNEEAKELEVGTVLDPDKLTPLGSGPEQKENYFEVKSYDELVDAISKAKDKVETTIVVTQSFEIIETIKIDANKIIVLTSKNEKAMDDEWKPIEQPKDYAEYGEEKQRDIIEEARDRGEEAIKDAENNIIKENDEYYYNFDGKDIIIKRSNTFTGTMFEVNGILTLGNKNSSINFDGNKKEVTLPTASEGQTNFKKWRDC